MSAEHLSLLDSAGMKTREWYVCYFDRDVSQPHYRMLRHLKPGFRHVELARPVQYGPAVSDVVWLLVLPALEMLDLECCLNPAPPWVRVPGATIQKVTASRPVGSMRSWFEIGPPSCVEVAKAALGINAFWVRTPWQLYQFINRRGGVINSR